MYINPDLIDAICMMDMSRIRFLLPSNGTYVSQDKEDFLRKLETKFLQLRANNEDSLVSFPGVCNGEACTNHGCPGYLFVAVKSHLSFNLVFENTGCATHCALFKEHGIAVPKGESLYLGSAYYPASEPIAQSDLEYLMLCARCKEASEDLLQFHDRVIDKNYYFSWLEKHHALYALIERHRTKDPIRDFCNLYTLMSDLRRYIGLSGEARKAVAAYPAPNDGNSETLKLWCEQHEELWMELSLCDFIGINPQHPEQSTPFYMEGLRIAPHDFYDVIRFNHLYLDSIGNVAEPEEIAV